MFKKIIKDNLDIAMANTHKQCLEYLHIISELRVEYQNTLEIYTKKVKELQDKHNKEIETLKKQIEEIKKKYV